MCYTICKLALLSYSYFCLTFQSLRRLPVCFIGLRASFFSRRAEPSLPENFFDSARKTAMLIANLQNYFARLTPPSKLLVKIPDFGHFISLDGMNSVFTARCTSA